MSNIDPELKDFLERDGYVSVELKNGKVCGLYHFMFTVAIVVGIDNTGYECRYCYNDITVAIGAYNDWDGYGDPKDYIVKK